MRYGLLLAFLFCSAVRAESLVCGIGSEEDNLKLKRTLSLNRGEKEQTLVYKDRNDYGVKYYHAKIYFDYRAEGDTDKDVVELVLTNSTSGMSSISSQKIRRLKGGEAFTVYLAASSIQYIQLLCLVKED